MPCPPTSSPRFAGPTLPGSLVRPLFGADGSGLPSQSSCPPWWRCIAGRGAPSRSGV